MTNPYMSVYIFICIYINVDDHSDNNVYNKYIMNNNSITSSVV